MHSAEITPLGDLSVCDPLDAQGTLGDNLALAQDILGMEISDTPSLPAVVLGTILQAKAHRTFDLALQDRALSSEEITRQVMAVYYDVRSEIQKGLEQNKPLETILAELANSEPEVFNRPTSAVPEETNVVVNGLVARLWRRKATHAPVPGRTVSTTA